MPSWKSLLAASCCLVLAASTASAALLYRGLSHTATGSATVEQLASGRLKVTNIGSSGQDGVSISTTGLDGVRLPMSGTIDPVTDVGSSMSLTYRWTVISQPAGSQASLSLVVQPTSLSFSPVLVSTISGGMRVRCSSGGALVLDSTIPFGSSVSMELPPGTTCPMPAMSCALDRVALEVRCSAEFSSNRVLFVGGQSVSCDAVTFSVLDNDCDDEDCDGSDSDLRVLSPPGSSFSSVECVRTDFVSHGRFMSGEGQVVVSPQVVTSHRRLPVTNIGSSGQDGVSLYRSPGSGGGGGGGFLCSPSTCGLSGGCKLHFAPPSLSFDPSVDEGKGCVTRVYGTSSSSPTETMLGSVHITITGGNFRAIPNFTGMAAQAESCAVFDNGIEVYRTAVSSGSSIGIVPPTGQPLGMAINEKGLPGEKKIKKKSTAAPQAGPGRAQPASADFVSEQDILPIEVGFAGDRVILFGGTRVTGDEMVFWGERAPTGAGSSLSISSQMCLVRCASSSSSTSMEVVGASSSSGDLVSCAAPSSTHLSTSSTCVVVPVVIDRIDATPVRAFSVTFHMSPELASCVSGVTEGDYLSRTASTQMFVVDNGGGSFTVDCSQLGGTCGSTGDGELFSLHLSASAPVSSALGSVRIDAVQLRDCSNADVPGAPGGSAFLPIDFTAPSPVSSVSVTTVMTGNDVSGTTKLHLSHSTLDPDAGVAVYAKPFGGYPEYDDDPTAGPPSPPSSEADAISQGWTLVDVSSDGMLDVVTGRGFYYFVVTVRDAYGNPSPMSSCTDGTLNYHLGDVSNGLVTCAGNNRVGPEDISMLGAHYGSSLSFGSSFACLDVGPTTDHSVHGRPMTDNKVSFEDLVVFAMNYLVVSGPRLASAPAAAAANVASLEVPELPAVGGTFDAVVRVEGAGNVQALSLKLDFDPAVLEQVSVAQGELLAAQDRESAVLSPGSGQIDAALLGGGTGLSGSGALARVTFRVKAAGDARLSLAGITARDGENQPVAMTAATGPVSGVTRTGLAMAYPNPFDDATTLRFGLASPSRVSLVVFDVAGRRVRRLLDGSLPSGERIVSWDGRDDAGLRLAPGAYVVRFEAGGQRESRVVRLVH